MDLVLQIWDSKNFQSALLDGGWCVEFAAADKDTHCLTCVVHRALCTLFHFFLQIKKLFLDVCDLSIKTLIIFGFIAIAFSWI